jgi:hypothetical protein
MSSNLHDPKAEEANHRAQDGLGPDELQAEQAGDLPERDAMSVIGVGGLEVGLPPPNFLDDVLEADLPVDTLPVDGLPVEHYPTDQLPIDRLPDELLPPVDPPIHTVPVEPPVDTAAEAPLGSAPSDLPDPPPVSVDTSVRA